MHDVILLSLSDRAGDACATSASDACAGSGQSGCGGSCGGDGCGAESAATAGSRVPVLTCVDALRSGGALVETVTAGSDAEIDAVIKIIEAGEAKLIIAAAADGQLRAVLRRLVRRYAPPPSKRPDDLPADRTLPDLPPVGVLPLLPAVPQLVTRLGLPRDPAAVAAATLAGRARRLDLLRNDGGSVTVRGALLGGSLAGAPPAPWRGRVEVDDAVLSSGDEPVLACAITNVGSSSVDGLPLVRTTQPDDGLVDVAIAVPAVRRRLLRSATVRLEVRRARGRAVAVTPRQAELPIVDDGVSAVLTRKRSWWVEREVWAAYVV